MLGLAGNFFLQAQYIASVHEYVPAPGQFINAAPWGTPASTQSILGGIDGSLSLGAFGGYVVFSFADPVENHPDNPYGVDFSIFGNPMLGSSEPGQVFVAKDLNQNGIPDDPWYAIAGSDHFFPATSGDYEITYVNPGGAEDVPWSDNHGGEGYIYTNATHEQPYYPVADSFPDIPGTQYTLSGYSLQGSIDTGNPVFVTSAQRMFGYADNRLRGSAPYTLPDNPYTPEKENSGGDAIDISWAVNENHEYIDLDAIHFLKVQTAMMGDRGWLGEISTEITGAVDVDPDPAISGITDVIVIRDLPLLVDTSLIQLDAYAFLSGRYSPGTAIGWETNVDWAAIDEHGLMTLTGSGDVEITAFLLSDPGISTSITCHVELPFAVPEFPATGINVYPNPAGETIRISGISNALIEVFSMEGRKVLQIEHFSESVPVSVGDLPEGIYLVRITSRDLYHTLKLIRR